MDVGTTLTVSTGREHRPVVGGDSTVFEMHSEFYVDVGQGQRVLAITPFMRFLEELAEVQAANLGEELHHADFVITTDPKVVRELGLMHDCADCQDSMSQTMAFMASNPDQEMVVGQMFWAGT